MLLEQNGYSEKKMNEQGEVERNKGKLVWKGYSHQEGVHDEDTYAHVARMKVERMFLPYVEKINSKCIRWMSNQPS